MLLIDRPAAAPDDLDALIEEARRRTRKRRQRFAVVLLVAAAGAAYLVGGAGGGGSGRAVSSGHRAPIPAGGARGEPQSIAAARLTVLRDIGEFGLLAPGEGWAVNGVSFYFTSDSGARWRSLRVPKLTGGDVVADVFTAASLGRNDLFLSYATSVRYGSCARPTAPGAPLAHELAIGSIARTTDRGRTWQLSQLPGCIVARSLSFLNARTGFALAQPTAPPLYPELLVTRDGGRTWRRIAATPFAGSIDFATASNGWGVAGPVAHARRGLPHTFGGALYRTRNGGRSWQRQPICTTASARGTFTICEPPRFFGARFGVLPVMTVDRQTDRKWQTIYRTTNGGRTWTSSTPLPSVPTGPGPQDVSVEAGKFVAVSASRWIVLVGRHLYTTTDAGRQWTTRVPKPDFSASRVFEFDFASANDGWLLADPFSSAGNAPPAFDYTDDGGLTWHRLGGR